jgi:hypothetical protein
MLQKIKYPVGSKLISCRGDMITLEDLTPNQKLCLVSFGEGEQLYKWYSQRELDFFIYKPISTPRWIPEIGERYFASSNVGDLNSWNWCNNDWDRFRLKSDNVFKTREECQKKIEEINSREI